jgi:hypothetical protein
MLSFGRQDRMGSISRMIVEVYQHRASSTTSVVDAKEQFVNA